MEGVPILRDLTEAKDWTCKIDLKDAYTMVPIHSESCQYLSFLHHGTSYQYKPLTFGMSVVPRVFSKLMRFVMEPLRIQEIQTVFYLDDICLLARAKEEMYKSVQAMLAHLNKLEFIINYSKSKLIPEKIQYFLGFQFNTKTITISVPTTKMEKLTSRVK